VDVDFGELTRDAVRLLGVALLVLSFFFLVGLVG